MPPKTSRITVLLSTKNIFSRTVKMSRNGEHGIKDKLRVSRNCEITGVKYSNPRGGSEISIKIKIFKAEIWLAVDIVHNCCEQMFVCELLQYPLITFLFSLWQIKGRFERQNKPLQKNHISLFIWRVLQIILLCFNNCVWTRMSAETC